jgi:DNA end-binding protein Ku
MSLPEPIAPAPEPSATTEAGLTNAPRGRASWSGLLKLSLVTVPVKAYPAATSSQETHFNQLHAGCGQRIRYEKHCPVHGKVDAGAIASGYPYAPGQYLILDEAELDKLRPAKDKALSLERFVDPSHIDPILFAGRSLYLLPDGPAAHHPYLVLAQAMHQRQKWALGRVVLGGRRALTLVRPVGRLLTVHVLHFPAQLRSRAAWETELRGSGATADESQLAGQLIEAASAATVAWSEYRDDTAAQLAALVEAKLQGRPLPAAAPEEGAMGNLLEALQRSVAQAQEPKVLSVRRAAPTAEGRKKNSRRTP